MILLLSNPVSEDETEDIYVRILYQINPVEYFYLYKPQTDISFLHNFLVEMKNVIPQEFKFACRSINGIPSFGFNISKKEDGLYFTCSSISAIRLCKNVLAAISIHTSKLYIQQEVDKTIHETETELPMEDKEKIVINADELTRAIQKANPEVEIHYQIKMSTEAVFDREISNAFFNISADSIVDAIYKLGEMEEKKKPQ